MGERVLGVIGGSGLYDLPGLAEVAELDVETPFGAPSDRIVRGRLGATTLLFLPRHGRGHGIPPHRINYRANVLALKIAGAEQVVSVSAVGSMKESIAPGDMVVVDQFIDQTRRRTSTFFDDVGVAAHVELAEPIDAQLADALARAATSAGARVHRGGTYLCIDGPQFSTRAESELYRSFGVSVIGMTNMPEAKLAREAELPYATLAMVTDYDCWHEGHAAVTVRAVMEVMQKNVALARATIAALAGDVPDPAGRPATRAMAAALITPREHISESARRTLAPLIGRYLT